MANETIFICAGCDASAAGLAASLREALDRAGLTVKVAQPECMNVCARPITVAARAPGKHAYLFGDVDPARDLEGLVAFARLYAAAPDGAIEDARPLGELRTRLIGKIPASIA